jgi:hypothetical protein
LGGSNTDTLGKSVIIYGLGASRAFCPFDDEVWAVNTAYAPIYQARGRLDKLFLGHDLQPYPTLVGQDMAVRGFRYEDWGWNYIASLSRYIDVIAFRKVPNVKVRIYPRRRIIDKFQTEFFTDTFCYMIAYAIDKNYTDIRIYGIDMNDKEEYCWEKGGIEYWIGYARGKGIKVWVHPLSNLCKMTTEIPYGTRVSSLWGLARLTPNVPLTEKLGR